MNRLPVVSGRKLIKVLSNIGFIVHHQKGSHIVLKRDCPHCRVTVPDHKVLKIGTLLSILKLAGITRGEFERLI